MNANGMINMVVLHFDFRIDQIDKLNSGNGQKCIIVVCLIVSLHW